MDDQPLDRQSDEALELAAVARGLVAALDFADRTEIHSMFGAEAALALDAVLGGGADDATRRRMLQLLACLCRISVQLGTTFDRWTGVISEADGAPAPALGVVLRALENAGETW